jgi:ribosomal protein S18 acetylase RimI-like enzyme
MLHLAQSLQHRSDSWEVEVFQWIAAPAGADGALDSPELGKRIWLYEDDGEVVGFAALGRTKWIYPTDSSPKVPHLHIINVGVDSRYRSRPEGPREDRYSWQILNDLVAEARATANMHRILTLYVHPANLAAIAFYSAYGFEFLPHQVYLDETNGVQYRGMVAKF